MLICQSLSAGLVAADRALNGCVRQVAAEHWLFRYPAQNSGLYRKTVLFHAVSALLPQCVVRTSMVHENPILVLLQGIPPPKYHEYFAHVTQSACGKRRHGNVIFLVG